MDILRIYTDGACSNNQGENTIGGYGSVLEYKENVKEIHGGMKNTTNNRMELLAVIEAFKALKKEGQTIEVFTDSSYVSNCFKEKWYESWEKNGWKNAKKEPVENKDLWVELLELTRKHSVKFYRVKGHINLNSENTNFKGHYTKFKEVNGNKFSFKEFLHIVEMNNRCDSLANEGIDENR